MCGICGIMLENCGCYNDFPIGSILYKMMESQQIRAQDSTGIAIFNKKFDHEFYDIEYFKKENDKYNWEHSLHRCRATGHKSKQNTKGTKADAGYGRQS